MNSRSNSVRTGFTLNRLTPAALVLAGALVGSALSPVLGPSRAAAAAELQDKGDTLSPFNAGDQRRQMIVQLTDIAQRLGKLETKMSSGISVKVTEMPAVTVKESPGK